VTALLAGIRVLDLTNVLAGPFCGYQLALLGADVIKVEAPEGDLARQFGANPTLNERGMGASFLAQNAGKRSVVLDLKSEAGHAAFLDLVASADVVLENFRPGVMDRLDLSVARLRERRPDLIYCAISGFGQTGPMRDNPAYDQIVQGLSGVMSITGTPEAAPLARRLSRLRHPGGPLRSLRDRRGAGSPGAHGRGRRPRRLNARVDLERHGLASVELSHGRSRPHAHGQRE
jgi:crotonobetainyl-CoA:carnitine CoA-transferase CaiB-like acyl-CoA transferase